MTLPAMIPLNPSRPCLTPHQLLWRQDGSIRAPVIGVVDAHLPVGQALDYLLQRGFVTAATFPVKQSICTSIQRFPEPELVPFFLIECHVSSSSKITAVPSGLGFSKCSWAKARIQF